MTSEELYRLFLEGIRKSNTGVVTPDAFNYLINEWGQYDWLGGLDIENNQNDIDMAAPVMVITDGFYDYNGTILAPIEPSSGNYFPYPYNENSLSIGGIEYPEHFRTLRLRFKIEYVNHDCKSGLSDWLSTTLLKTDLENPVRDNPFRKPSQDSLYHKFRKGLIELICGNGVPKQMLLEYVRKPKRIVYDDSVPANNVSSEFPYKTNLEIIDHAVRIFIERVKDPRYQSLLNELQLKLINK